MRLLTLSHHQQVGTRPLNMISIPLCRQAINQSIWDHLKHGLSLLQKTASAHTQQQVSTSCCTLQTPALSAGSLTTLLPA